MWHDFENSPDFNERLLPRLMAIANKEVHGKPGIKTEWVQHWKSDRKYQYINNKKEEH